MPIAELLQSIKLEVSIEVERLQTERRREVSDRPKDSVEARRSNSPPNADTERPSQA